MCVQNLKFVALPIPEIIRVKAESVTCEITDRRLGMQTVPIQNVGGHKMFYLWRHSQRNICCHRPSVIQIESFDFYRDRLSVCLFQIL